jgi:hypothetical protein
MGDKEDVRDFLFGVITHDEVDYDGLFEGMCYSNNTEYIGSTLEQNLVDPHAGIPWAVRGGHADLVDRLYYCETSACRCADAWHQRVMNAAFPDVAATGNLVMVLFLMDRGADDYSGALKAAACAGQIDAMLVLRKRCTAAMLNEALACAIASEQFSAVEYLINEGANDWQSALNVARRLNNRDLIEFFQNKICRRKE